MKVSVSSRSPIGLHAREWVTILFELTKIKISLLAMLSTASGFILATGQWTTEIFAPTGGIFLLACGSSAINHYQESRFDALMERTKRRPIPDGRISPSAVLPVAFFFILTGSWILFSARNLTALGLGLFAVLWYNGVYTRLKRTTPFAIIPGALVGAIPPVVGWVSGKGHLSMDPEIFAFSFFFFMWQVPHCGLLLLNFGKDYEKTGLPCLAQILTPSQLSRITFLWIAGTAVTGMALSFLGMVKSHAIHGALFAAGFWLVWKTSRILKADSRLFLFRNAFNIINFYVLVVMVLIPLDRLFG